MRKYEKTHPWLTYKLDLREFNYTLWLKLGEVKSKCEHIMGVPLQPSISQKLHEIYLAKGALATTAIEGNTLTEQEVLDHLEGKLKLPPSKEYLKKEVDNIVEACNQVGEKVHTGKSPKLNVKQIKNFNHMVLKNLSLEEGVVPGQIRKVSVGVAHYLAAPSEDCEFLLERLCDWLNHNFKSPEDYEIIFGLIKAIVAHIYLAWIHPFGDGNGRTARLVEFKILLFLGVPTPAAHLLSNHYNQTRNEYYRQLDQASKTGGNIIPFIEYAVQGFLDGLKEQLKFIKHQHWDVSWENYIYGVFREKENESARRQRNLVLDLSKKDDTVPISKVREISPRIAKAYAKKTDKTLQNDIKKLISMDLIEKNVNGLRAKREIILSFLPPVKMD